MKYLLVYGELLPIARHELLHRRKHVVAILL
jgi:hypothetical protein